MNKSNWVLLIAVGIIVAIYFNITNKQKIDIKGDYICVDGCFIESLEITKKFITIERSALWLSELASFEPYEIEDDVIYSNYGIFKIIDQNIIVGEGLLFTGTYVKKEFITTYIDNYFNSLLGYYKVSTPALNIRSGPGISYKSLGTLRYGDTVEVIESDSNSRQWHKIKTKYKEGYVAGKFLEKVNKATY